MRSMLATSMLVLLSACSGPFLGLPGGQLQGAESPLDLTSLPADATIIELETNPDDPYSVLIGFRVIDGQIYIDPAAERRWYQNIVANPNVRLRFDGGQTIHPAIALEESNPQITQQFEADRIVLRLTPRN